MLNEREQPDIATVVFPEKERIVLNIDGKNESYAVTAELTAKRFNDKNYFDLRGEQVRPTITGNVVTNLALLD